MNTQQKGEYAHLKVQLRAIEKGCTVSIPLLPVRYDLIVDDGKDLHRVQVKYADGRTTHAEGSVVVNLRRWAGDKRTETRNYRKGEVDAILVYVAPVDVLCWLPIEMVDDKSSIVLRFAKAKKKTPRAHLVEDLEW